MDMIGTFPWISGITVSSSSPSETIIAPSALYSFNTLSISSPIFASPSIPLLYFPATRLTSTSNPFDRKSS